MSARAAVRSERPNVRERSRGGLSGDRVAVGRSSGMSSSRAARGVRGRALVPREGADRVSEVQRARILSAITWLVAEEGTGAVTVARVVTRANVSRRTFYDHFSSCDDCFGAAFDRAVDRAAQRADRAATAAAASETVANASSSSSSSLWRERVRASLAALLGFCDEESAAASLLVVGALGAGPRVLERRAEILSQLAHAIDRGRPETGRNAATASPLLVAEGTVGAVLAIVHARMLERDTARRPLLELLNPLMGMIVLPYLGSAAAARERERPLPRAATARRRTTDVASQARAAARGDSPAPLEGLKMRLTYRTLMVLTAIAAEPGASNRQVADAAGIHDQGQISKLLARLERLGLAHNAGSGQPQGEPNAWTLTARGTQIQQTLTDEH
jgi:AcrR family transcriptional regulator